MLLLHMCRLLSCTSCCVRIASFKSQSLGWWQLVKFWRLNCFRADGCISSLIFYSCLPTILSSISLRCCRYWHVCLIYWGIRCPRDHESWWLRILALSLRWVIGCSYRCCTMVILLITTMILLDLHEFTIAAAHMLTFLHPIMSRRWASNVCIWASPCNYEISTSTPWLVLPGSGHRLMLFSWVTVRAWYRWVRWIHWLQEVTVVDSRSLLSGIG